MTNKKVIEKWAEIINSKKEGCVKCGGVFHSRELKIDYDNKLICKSCYKERYSFYA